MRHIIFLISAILFSCQEGKVSKIQETGSEYLNHHDSVAYVGKEVCMTCHKEIYDSFIQTGMGLSFDHATKTKSVIDDNDNPLVFDKDKNLYYQPLWKNDSLYILEFRIENKDTTHKLIQKIDFIIGSGHHTNSHLYSINGYLHQAPYTFYTQKQQADLPPGYEDGNNSRFSREIGLECMSCHNAYPNHQENTINKYNSMPNGIDCERCHGPGEIHVQQKRKGVVIENDKIDYSIVNPSKLSNDLQFDICSRCHLQGISILREGKDWDDFYPGTKLKNTMEIFLPKYEDGQTFIMASHVERLQQTSCYTKGGVTCITCHAPHKSVTRLSNNYFNNKCLDCHKVCEDNKEYNNCISCHMPKSSSSDIPHVSITDHKISVHNQTQLTSGKFMGLICINNENPSSLSKAKAYIKYYESFDPISSYLDSAETYLKKCNSEESFPLYIQYWYLKKEYIKLIKHVENGDLDKYIKILTVNELSFNYSRIAEAYNKYDFIEDAYYYYLKAIEISPDNLDFLLKTSILEIKMSKFDLAKKRLEKIIMLNPNFEKAYFNLGSILMNIYKEYDKASECFNKALKLDPDYQEAKDNLKHLNSIYE